MVYRLLVIVFCLGVALPARAEDGPRVGIEAEYAATGFLRSESGPILREAFKRPLRFVAAVLGDKQGVISLKPWSRDENFEMGAYVDPSGRPWSVVPEHLNSDSERDGFELVSPPLSSDQDFARLEEVLGKIAASGEYMPAARSSLHVTVDASSLIGPSGDASRLVKTILFIETHWPQIYAAVSPRRYGTVVNRYSVPTAATSSELIRALKALPPGEQTFEKVRALFQSLGAREDSPMKMRAANYAKLFGLEGNPRNAVIEFRIADLNAPHRVLANARFFRALVVQGGNYEPGSDELPPYDSKAGWSRTLRELSRHMLERGEKGYEDFLGKLSLDPARYPAFGSLDDPARASVHYRASAASDSRGRWLEKTARATWVERLENHAHLNFARALTGEERAVAELLPTEGSLGLPLYRLEDAPYVGELDRTRFRDAGNRLVAQVFSLVHTIASGTVAVGAPAVKNIYSQWVEAWADGAELHETLEKASPVSGKRKKAKGRSHAWGVDCGADLSALYEDE